MIIVSAPRNGHDADAPIDRLEFQDVRGRKIGVLPGPESLEDIEAELRDEVAALAVDPPLPDTLAVEVFLGKNAADMARRRQDDDLPPA